MRGLEEGNPRGNYPMITSTGIYTIDAVTYHGDPCAAPSLSASIAKLLINQSPLHAFYAHPRLSANPVRYEADYMDVGVICHALLLEGADVAHVIQATRKEGSGKNRVDTGELVTDYRTKEAREERDAARASGKVPILASKMEPITEMLKAIRPQLDEHEASNAFTDGKPEQVIVWREESGIYCRARLDWLHDSHCFIDDFKTTGGSAAPEVISRKIFQDGLDIQAAFYRRGLQMIDGNMGSDHPQFRFIFQETDPPYAVSVYSLAPSALSLAEAKVEYAIEKWGECLKSGKWPGYENRIVYAEASPWQESAWMEKTL